MEAIIPFSLLALLLAACCHLAWQHASHRLAPVLLLVLSIFMVAVISPAALSGDLFTLVGSTVAYLASKVFDFIIGFFQTPPQSTLK